MDLVHMQESMVALLSLNIDPWNFIENQVPEYLSQEKSGYKERLFHSFSMLRFLEFTVWYVDVVLQVLFSQDLSM